MSYKRDDTGAPPAAAVVARERSTSVGRDAAGPEGELSGLETLARSAPRRRPADGAAGRGGSVVGICVRSDPEGAEGRVRVRFEDTVGELREEWAAYLEGLVPAEGDAVLVEQPRGSAVSVVVGRLATPGESASIALPGGHKLVQAGNREAERGPALRLELADGRVALEMDFAGETPTVRLPEKDLSLDLEGRLKIAARSIDLVSKLGNVNVKANDDFRATGERIWLN